MTPPPPEREARFRALFTDAYADVLRFAQRRAHPDHAEDIVAEAFLVAWRRLDQAPRRPGDLRAWLFGITRNCLLNARRGDQRREALAVRVGETTRADAGSPGPDALAARLDLVAAWKRLGDTDQEALALAVLDDLTSPQAARVLGITPAAFRLRLLRARRALRRELDGPGARALAEEETSA